MEKGEIIEWVVEDKHTLIIKRVQRRAETSALKGKRRG